MVQDPQIKSSTERAGVVTDSPIRASDFLVSTVQVGVLTPSLSEFAPGLILGTVLSKLADRYDGPPVSVTLPSEIPPEVPRIILSSANQVWEFKAAPARIDSVWIQRGGENPPATIVQDCLLPIMHCLSTIGLSVGRLVLLVTRGCAAENPASRLVAHFCSDGARKGALKRSENFELHNHKHYRLDKVDVNSWMRCKTGIYAPTQSSAVVVEQDLNTLEGQPTVVGFGQTEIEQFYECAWQEMTSILGLYFP